MVGRKPLHGLMLDGKFQFGHYKEFAPMNLFSEELKLGIQSDMYEYKIFPKFGVKWREIIVKILKIQCKIGS